MLEREVDSGADAAPALARDEDRGALPRRAPEARPRDARVREGAHPRRAQPRGRRGADPAVRARAATRARRSSRVLEIQLGATPTDDQITRQERIKRLAEYNEEKPARQGRRVRLVDQGARRGPRGECDPDRVRAAGRGDPGLARAGRRLRRRRCRSSAHQAGRAAADAGDGARDRAGAGRDRPARSR